MLLRAESHHAADRAADRVTQAVARGAAHFALRLVAAVAVTLLPGCSVLPEQLSVRDKSSPSIALLAAIRPAAWSRSPGSQPGIAFGYERHRAEDTRVLATGETLSLGGRLLSGPDTLTQTATVQLAHVAYTHRFRFGPNFEFEPFGGVARLEMRYRAQPAAAPSPSELKEARTLAYGGLTPRWRFNEWVAIEARLSAAEGGRAQGRGAELAAVLSPTPGLSLRLGYSERRQVLEFFADGVWTEVDVRARGPSAGLQFEF